MSDLNIEGMTIAPGVVETIISLAARDVEGVASIGPATTSGLMDLIGGGRPSTQGVEVTTDENDELHVSIRMDVKSGNVRPDLAANVRRAVVDAIATQVGVKVAAVDIYIDGIQFEY